MIFEGRGSDFVSATCRGWNHHSIGIGFIGSYIEEKPSPISINALQNFLDHLVDKSAFLFLTSVQFNKIKHEKKIKTS